MVRSLWTGATGMIAQQTSLDNIANNLANVNTMGYKSQSIEFKSLLYQTMQTRTTSANGDAKPSSAQVGLGTRVSSINTSFRQGSLLASELDTSFALSGKGFFGVRGGDGNTYYTRNGNFQWTTYTNGSNMLADSDGNPVLDTQNRPIVLGSQYQTSLIQVSKEGEVMYPDANNNLQSTGYKIGRWQFSNPNGLYREGDSLYSQTAASGQPINEETATNIQKTQVIQGYLEGSNVQVADEMVNMITTQRAYEFNSKVITTSDTMLEEANNLRR
ncbi:MAG: flagellar hook-basal body protein [Lachnospiraceae bacterium]|nr:flagellar hook-basal body protein [Lachnospiraceae bacterium]MCR5476462.1 flagellar hook-basal body protein [Lachnospiraceae bacterium]